jgi:hypothetical protein
MSKRAVSVTLAESNVVWLRAKTLAAGGRSLSETLDRLIESARLAETKHTEARSVVGMLRIAESDPELAGADAALRDLFTAQLGAERLRPRRRSRAKTPSGSRRG